MIEYVRQVLSRIEAGYEWFIVDLLGYDKAIYFEEVVLVFGGIVIGYIVASLLMANFLRKVYKIDDFGHKEVCMSRITYGGKSRFTIKFVGLAETFRQVILLAFSQFCTVKRFGQKDAKRTRICIGIIFLISVAILLFSILAIASELAPIK